MIELKISVGDTDVKIDVERVGGGQYISCPAEPTEVPEDYNMPNFNGLRRMMPAEKASYLAEHGFCPYAEKSICPEIERESGCEDCIYSWLKNKERML